MIIGKQTLNGVDLLNVDTDPSVSGVAANQGSLALISGGPFVKTGATNTDWSPIQGGVTKNQNAIINGNFDFWQRGITFPAPYSLYTADRWNNLNSSTAVYTISRSTNVPTQAQSGVLSTYSLKVHVTTADAAPNFVLTPFHLLEGYNFRTLAQKTLTFSFWVSSPKTGVHCMTFFNFGLNRSIVKEYTVNAANTWEQKFVTLAASPSAGTWRYNIQVGLQIGFTTACSNATYQTTPDTWQTGLFYATSNQVNCVDTIGNDFYVSQVKLEAGSTATAFEIEPFDKELARCQRYYTTSVDGSGDPIFSMCVSVVNSKIGNDVYFPVSMRTQPTIVLNDGTSGNATWLQHGVAFVSLASNAAQINVGFFASQSLAADVLIANRVYFDYTADAEI